MKKSIPLLLILFLFGCHAAEVVKFNSSNYAPTQEVKIFTELPKDEYEELGYVEAKGGITVTKETLLQDMIEKAKQNGADGLIKVEFYDRPQYNQTLGYIEKPAAKAVMIKFKNNNKNN